MSIINYHDPTVIQMNLDDNGQPVSIPIVNETKQVVDGKIPLEGLPDEQYRIQITGYVEINVKDRIDSPEKFKCDYTHGVLYFDQSLNGKVINIDKYYSRGQFYISSSRVWTKLSDTGEVLETFDDAVNRIGEVYGAVTNLDNTIDGANTVKSNLDNSISTGNTAKSNLDTSIDSANTINGTLSNSTTGTIKKATDINTALSNTTSTAKSTNTTLSQTDTQAQTTKSNLDSSISTGNTLKTNLNSNISTGTTLKNNLDTNISEGNQLKIDLPPIINNANTSKTNLETTIGNANSSKINLDNSIDKATTKKTGLDASVTNAEAINDTLSNVTTGTIKKATDIDTTLNTSIDSARTSKTNLDDSISDANTSKTNLDTSISSSTTAKSDLDGSISTANTTKTALDESIASGNINEINNKINNLNTKIGNIGTKEIDESGFVEDTDKYELEFDKKYNKWIVKPSLRLMIYGIEIDESNSNPNTRVAYTDDAVGFTPASGNDGNFNWGSWENIVKNEFQIKPCVLQNKQVNYYLNHEDYTKKADGTTSKLDGTDGDVMVEFGILIYYKWTTVGNIQKIQVSTGYFDGAVKYAHEVEDGYNQMPYYPLLLTQILSPLIFKSTDSQTALGRGRVGGAGYINTGNTDTKGFMYGSKSDEQMKFLGIEDYWGNKYYWIDGLVTDSSYNLLIGNSNFNDGGSGYAQFLSGRSFSISGYVDKVQGGNDKGFIIKSSDGSETTHYCDYGNLGSGKVARFGASSSSGSDGGFAQLQLSHSASAAYSNFAARLFCKSNDKIYIGAYLGAEQNGKLRSISGVTPTDSKTIGSFRTLARANN